MGGRDPIQTDFQGTPPTILFNSVSGQEALAEDMRSLGAWKPGRKLSMVRIHWKPTINLPVKCCWPTFWVSSVSLKM